jgi:alpha-beta hydrolase superfamily lysophospholipase
MRGLRRSVARLVLMVLAVGFSSGLPEPASAVPGDSGTGAPVCAAARVPTGALEIAGTLCSPATGPAGTVMVLVPGATYTSSYWDIPVDPGTYDFRLAMNRAGYSTFTLDLLGSGASSKPLAATATFTRQAEAVHDVIGALRAGLPGHRPFARVVLGGHSIGAAVAIGEATRYHDEDAVLLTGFSHSPNAVGLVELFATFIPATLDPRFAGRDPAYLTTRPGTRSVFYGSPGVAPEIAAYDEATKDVVSVVETPEPIMTTVPVPPSVLDAALIPSTVAITASVALVDGGEDPQFCFATTGNCADSATLDAAERPFFPQAPSFEAHVVPGAGHTLNLARTAPQAYRVILNWARRTVPADAG